MADRGDRPIFTNTLNQLVFEPSGPRNTGRPKTKDTSVYRPPDARQRGEKQFICGQCYQLGPPRTFTKHRF